MRAMAVAVLCVGAMGAAGCGGAGAQPDVFDVAVANPYLALPVWDLTGPDTPVFRMGGGPGACPGHFDVIPAEVMQLRAARVLLRLDFQRGIDDKLQSAIQAGLRITEVRIRGGLCEPESYLSACRQTATALVAARLIDRAAADARLARIKTRVDAAAGKARADVTAAGLAGAPVLASKHQERFCRWLGLDVVAAFAGDDDPAAVNRAVAAAKARTARLVVANVPEGRQVADRLAGAVGGRVVMLENFPAGEPARDGFDALLAANVARLIEARGGE